MDKTEELIKELIKDNLVVTVSKRNINEYEFNIEEKKYRAVKIFLSQLTKDIYAIYKIESNEVFELLNEEECEELYDEIYGAYL